MAESSVRASWWRSIRWRTTAAAVAVVALALVLGAVALVLLLRGTLRDGLENTAEDRAAEIADQLKSGEVPAAGEGDEDDEGDEDGDDPEDLVWQVAREDGGVVSSSQPLSRPLPTDETDSVDLPGADHAYLVRVESEGDYVVSVAVTTEEVDDSTAALVPLLGVGLPLLLLLVGGVTWVVASRALAPVEAIRREVTAIGADQLHRRVPEPPVRDEVHRLAVTMNSMLDRVERSQETQRRFVSDASHELRSPLAGLRQTAEVAQAHPDAFPPGELTETVLDETLRMQRLVEQLLQLSRVDAGVSSGERREVDLDDLLLREASRLRRQGIEVDSSAVAPVRVIGDEVALAQVLRNLMDNAARHASSTVMARLRSDGAMAELAVEDDGTGVPEADSQRIFERFVRLDEARSRDAGGSGLGLAIAAELVGAHGGTVYVGAAPSGGARFVVRLPAQPTVG